MTVEKIWVLMEHKKGMTRQSDLEGPRVTVKYWVEGYTRPGGGIYVGPMPKEGRFSASPFISPDTPVKAKNPRNVLFDEEFEYGVRPPELSADAGEWPLKTFVGVDSLYKRTGVYQKDLAEGA